MKSAVSKGLGLIFFGSVLRVEPRVSKASVILKYQREENTKSSTREIWSVLKDPVKNQQKYWKVKNAKNVKKSTKEKYLSYVSIDKYIKNRYILQKKCTFAIYWYY